MATTNRMAASSNGHAEAAAPRPQPATEAQDVAELKHAAESALVDCHYAIRQLQQYRDIGRALDGLERVKERLAEIVRG